ncbi:hypothetical protein LJB42_001109 [Komagataella kurtzmanii]|nr:hypothetical protein LJB42_001109 [Komagataella kurtzmanii]
MKAKHSDSFAIIGAGPSGLSAIKGLHKELGPDFDKVKIKVFDRRGKIGGLWNYIPNPDPIPTRKEIEEERGLNEQLQKLENIVEGEEVVTDQSKKPVAYNTSGIYNYLQTNLPSVVMQFSYNPLKPEDVKETLLKDNYLFKGFEGDYEKYPFRHYTSVYQYIRDTFDQFLDKVQLNTNIERVQKDPETGEWKLTIRQFKDGKDVWSIEYFDSVIVCVGQNNIPYIPANIENAVEQIRAENPDLIEHSQTFRRIEDYKGLKLVVVGASYSACDFISDVYPICQLPIHVVTRGGEMKEYPFRKPIYEGDEKNINITHEITTLEKDSNGKLRITTKDGQILEDVDKLIIATGYKHYFPFLKEEDGLNLINKNGRVSQLYQHIFYIPDPSLTFLSVANGTYTFTVFEYQSALIARFLTGKVELPEREEQEAWIQNRVNLKSDTTFFHMIPYEEAGEYFQDLVRLAADPELTFDSDKIYNATKAGQELKSKYWARNKEIRKLGTSA